MIVRDPRAFHVHRVAFEDFADEILELDKRHFLGEPDLVPHEFHEWWVATDSAGDVVGCAGLRPWRWSPPGERWAFLSRACVDGHARGARLQRRFIHARRLFARTSGFTRAITYTAPWNAASMRSLISAGFRPFEPANPPYEGVVYWAR